MTYFNGNILTSQVIKILIHSDIIISQLSVENRSLYVTHESDMYE